MQTWATTMQKVLHFISEHQLGLQFQLTTPDLGAENGMGCMEPLLKQAVRATVEP